MHRIFAPDSGAREPPGRCGFNGKLSVAKSAPRMVFVVAQCACACGERGFALQACHRNVPVVHPYVDADARPHECKSSMGIYYFWHCCWLDLHACWRPSAYSVTCGTAVAIYHNGSTYYTGLLHLSSRAQKCCCKHGRVGRKGVGQEGGPLYICCRRVHVAKPLQHVWSGVSKPHTPWSRPPAGSAGCGDVAKPPQHVWSGVSSQNPTPRGAAGGRGRTRDVL